MAEPLNPRLPEVGEKITVLGVRAEVLAVEPQSDWTWLIDLVSIDAHGADQRWSIDIPTDFRTTDGLPSYTKEH